MSNARIVAQTASELEEPAEVLVRRRRQRPGSGSRITREPDSRPNSSSMRTVPSSSSGPVLCRRALTDGEREQAEADHERDRDARHRPVRQLRREQHPDDERRARGRGRTAGARRPSRSASPRCPAAPASAARARRRAPARRRGRAARRSRTGRRRTPRRRCGSAARGAGTACLITVCQDARAHDDREQVQPDRGDDPLPADRR